MSDAPSVVGYGNYVDYLAGYQNWADATIKRLEQEVKHLEMECSATPLSGLLDIIEESKAGPAPTTTTRYDKWLEVLVSIDADHVAHVTLTREAYDKCVDLLRDGSSRANSEEYSND